ncbi:MAG: ABC transporter substrate-binding protein [Campylobacterota bacterium]|nr:ABC transporter substrate-binding protein [Campylobacterota bacterium]
MIKKIYLIVSLVVFATFLDANSSDISYVKSNFTKNLDKIINYVKNKNISKNERNSEVVKILTPMFDFELMAKLSLGKQWKGLDKNNRERFITLYVERMKKSYSSKLDSYSDEKVNILNITQPKPNRIVLETDIESDENKHFEVVYKLYKPKKELKNKDKWLIYDVEIMGVSILKTDKSQFKDFLKNKTIKELMDNLEKQ